VIIPAIPAALGNFALPLLLGARDVAFPRINLMSLYLYWTGALMALGTALYGRRRHWLDILHSPTVRLPAAGVTLMVLAAFVLGFSSIFYGRPIYSYSAQTARGLHGLVRHAVVLLGHVLNGH